MVDENGRPQSVNSERYQEMLTQHVWPEVRNLSSRRSYWFMQDGATSHTTNLNINFLIDKFRGRVISRRSPLGHEWPPYSPDLNPLDSFVWGYVEDQVRRIEPESIPELQRAVENVGATILTERMNDAAQNVRKHAQACLGASGGHFEH